MYSPAPWDFVWCAYPYDQDARTGVVRPGPKCRPAFILKVVSDVNTSEVWLAVAYGTTNRCV